MEKVAFNFENVKYCSTQSGKCQTDSSIIIWDPQELKTQCLYRNLGDIMQGYIRTISL